MNFDLPREELLSQMAYIANKIGLIQDIDLDSWYSKELLHSDTTYDRGFVLPDDILSTYEQLEEKSAQNVTVTLERVAQIPQESKSVIRNLLDEIQHQGNYFKKIKENDLIAIADLLQTLENQNLQIKRLQNEILDRDEEMPYLQRELYERNAELDAIKSSAIFNVFRRLTNLIDRWASPDTRRAEIVKLARSAVNIILNQGWKHLLWSIYYKLKLSVAGTNYLLRQNLQANLIVSTLPLSVEYLSINSELGVEEDHRLRDFMKVGSTNIFKLPRSPLVSIIIPTYYNVHYLKKCLQSLEEKTAYKNYEIIIVTNNKDENSAIRQYLSSLQHKVLLYPYEFSFGAINNYAAKVASGEFLLFLNDDTEIIDPYWLHALLKLGLDENAGAVGTKLVYPDKH
ncbi:MAG: glycosyltransferase, partial [Nitrososphaerales archaeon]